MPTLQDLNQTYELYFQGLNLNQGFKPELKTDFNSASIDDKQNILFTLPLPAIHRFIGGDSKDNSRQNDSMTPPREATYDIDGQTFTFRYSSDQHVNQFSTPIWDKNKLSEEKFVSKYVKPYLDQDVEYDEMYPEIENENIYLDLLFLSFQSSVPRVLGEADLELVLRGRLHDPIKRPLVVNFDGFKNKVKEGLGTFLKDKGTKIEPPDKPIELDSVFETQRDLKFLGISVKPDATCGYEFSHKPETMAYGVGFIEVKPPNFRLKRSYDLLCRTTQDESISFDRYGMTQAKGQVLELQKVIRKYVTTCAHSGCNRFIITDYQSVLFIHVNNKVALLKGDVGNADEEMPPGSTAGKTVRKPGPVRSTRDITRKGTDNDMLPLILISSKHFLVERTHRNIRLYTLSFLAMNENRITEMRTFLKNVIKVITREQNKAKKKTNTPPQSLGSEFSSPIEQRHPSKKQKTGNQGSSETVSGTISPPAEAFHFQKDLFTEEHSIDLGPINQRLLRVESMLKSQVIQIDSEKFRESIGSNFFSHDQTPNTSVLKIFDPLWGEELKDESGETFKYEYAHAISACVNEVKIYGHLQPIMGTTVPFAYGFGRLCDTHISSGTSYTRFWGPYIELQMVERDELFTEDLIGMDFVHASIIPQYRLLHSCGVLHRDFKFSNLIITKERQVFIIDFDKSGITDDETLFENELQSIISYFERPLDSR